MPSMPITKSAQKTLRQSRVKRARNISRKDKYRSLVKQFKKEIAAKNFETAKGILARIYKALDKAAKTNAIKKNKASRLKSRLTISLSKNISTS